MPESLSAIARRAPRTLGTLLLAWLAARAWKRSEAAVAVTV